MTVEVVGAGTVAAPLDFDGLFEAFPSKQFKNKINITVKQGKENSKTKNNLRGKNFEEDKIAEPEDGG
jgi:hypothetical protein